MKVLYIDSSVRDMQEHFLIMYTNRRLDMESHLYILIADIPTKLDKIINNKKMEKRINVFAKGMKTLKPLFDMGAHLKNSTLGLELIELVEIRVSQINKCAYCLDMHWKEARAKGQTEQRLYGLGAWDESPYYSDRERAALKWAEAVTAAHVSDTVYNEVQGHFSETELIDLTHAITLINTWNRINISFPSIAGSYKVGMFE